MTCVAVGEPKPYVKWMMGTWSLTPEEDMPLERNVLEVTNIREPATYTCVAMSPLGVIEATAQVSVEGVSSYIRFTKSLEDQTGIAHGVASFVCQAAGAPIPRITWKRNGRRIHSQQHFEVIDFNNGTSSVLRIQTLRLNRDDGTFECIASSSAGDITSSARLTVLHENQKPHGFPTIDSGPQIKVVKENRTALLHCAARGDPEPQIFWYKDMLPVNVDDSKGRIKQLSRGSLQIASSDESDWGKYECVAVNSFGTFYSQPANLYMSVLPIPPTLLTITETTTSSVTLTWDYEDDEPLSYYMIQYKSKNSDDFYDVKGILTLSYSIDGLRPNTEYQFRVLAVNEFGSGNPSDAVETRTREEVHLPAPLHVRARMLSSSVMFVQWEPIQEPNTQIKGYRVYYSADVTAPLSEWQQRETSDSSVIAISGLSPNVSYSLRVQGFTSGTDGPPSEILPLRTKQEVPGKPNMFVTITESIAVIYWLPPEDTDSDVIGYRLQYKRADDETFTLHEFRSTNRLHIISGLHKGATYTFRLAAYNSVGMGDADIQEMTIRHD